MKPFFGLTGGPGSGKSTLAAGFKRAGARIIDADHTGHALLHMVQIREHIKEVFGDTVFNASHEIDREQLGSIVFGDPEMLERLNRIIHPMLIRRLHQQIERFRTQDHATLAVLDMALLFELRFDAYCEPVIFVKAPLKRRKLWLKKARGWSEGEAQQRISGQLPEDVKERQADIIVSNMGSVRDLKDKAAVLYRKYCREAE
jgi:dephospho-CoA kinase